MTWLPACRIWIHSALQSLGAIPVDEVASSHFEILGPQSSDDKVLSGANPLPSIPAPTG